MYIIQTQNNRTLKQHRLNDPFLALVLYWVTGAMSWPRYSALTFINLPGWCSAEGAAPSEKTAAFKRWKCDGFACAQTQKNTSKFSWKKNKCVWALDLLTVIQVSLLGCLSWVSGRDAVQRVWISSTARTHGCFTLSCLSPAPADNKSPAFTVVRPRSAH